MITVTQSAKEMFETVEHATEHPEGQVLRLDLVGLDQFGVLFGSPEPDDQVVEHEGKDLFHISGEISQTADGATLDSVETPQGTTLVIAPPEEGEPALL